ncbi:hypothetical protein TVAG_307850 [Trichomonas vaginalis G3]|uniref:Uncharacterized protein n=1 Tax=Trichomonas vaginalis (strain ATCC PRA-98 / G3) TaxID=412133 RepID=A2F438_TRIV3|nr:hypothetical protein TVAGG3_0688050 [Trichomonas vaginalis G3]EAY00339.1 hypothetical protein TVAG_307850 [Trichomonas vaginalis G3]KAI5508367.1 hypothetical protein TVAGG3_0688050 [Trichomonas vaginalis G3]|eukprot:XP_001313268.1 hypothetical protein [Trichomonas vaginalis G3]
MISFLLALKAEDLFLEEVFHDPIIFPVKYSIHDVVKRNCEVNLDEQTISCPTGTEARNAAYVSTTLTNMPPGYFGILNFTGNSLINNPNQTIQIEVKSNGLSPSYFFKPDGKEYTTTVIPIVNDTFVRVFFISKNGESIFKIPELRFICKNIERKVYGKPKLDKIEKNVYRASVEITPADKLYIQTLFIPNSFDLPSTMYRYNYPIQDAKTDIMVLPVLANESIIIGYDI